MKITKVLGLEYSDKIISEVDFERLNIISTKTAISEYFNKYGYSFIEPFDLDNDLIIVQDKNLEVSMMLGMFYKTYRVINYRTGEIIDSKISSDYCDTSGAKMLSLTHRIIPYDKKFRLIKIDDNSTVLEADFIKIISRSKVLFRKYNIEYIIDLDTMDLYPIIKREYNIYQGPNPELFIDFRNGMYYQNQRCIFPVDIFRADIDFIVNTFPFGEKKERLFFLIDNNIKYGIRYEDEEIDEIWYDNELDRDNAYESIQNVILGVLEKERQKVKLKTE